MDLPMHRPIPTLSRLLLVPGVLFWLLPAVAHAQGSMIPVPREVNVISPDAQIESRAGFSGSVLGNLGYDTNISYGSGTAAVVGQRLENVTPGLSMALIPGIRYTSPQLLESERTGGKVHYGFEIRGIYRQYYSSDAEGINDPRFGAHLGGTLLYAPSKLFDLQLYEIFDRYTEPHYLVRDTLSQSWIQNQAGVLLRIIPGDGLFETVLRYNMNLYLFDGDQLDRSNKMEHNIQARVSYKFLPNSHLWLIGTYDINSYFDAAGGSDSMPIKVAGGVSTPILTSLAVSLGGGYGWGLYDSGASPDTWLLFAGLQYSMSARLKLQAKYEHTFEDALVGEYSDQHNFSVGATMPIGEKLLVTAQAGLRFVTFAGVPVRFDLPDTTTRADTIFFSDLSVSYKLRPDLLLQAHYKLMSDSTPYRYVANTVPDSDPDFGGLPITNNPSYMKHELYLSLAWHF